MCSMTCEHTTQSKLPSRNGSAVTEPCTRGTPSFRM